MAICGPALIPHSHFLGGPAVWTELDRDKQRAWHRRQQQTHSCGVHPEVWDPELGGDLDGLRLVSKVCRACEIAEQGWETYQKGRMAGEYQVWQFGPDADDPPLTATEEEGADVDPTP